MGNYFHILKKLVACQVFTAPEEGNLLIGHLAMAGRLHYLKTAKEAAGTCTQIRMKVSPKQLCCFKRYTEKIIVTHWINHNGINISLKETAGSIQMPGEKTIHF